MAGDNNEFHFPNPDDLPDGIDIDTLRLASTISGRLYEDSSTNTALFQDDLDGILKANNNKFPNLEVQFLDKGMHVLEFEALNNKPVFTAIITDKKNPDTLILGWRGTHEPMDLYRDLFGATPVDINGKNGDLRSGNIDDVFIQRAVYKVLKEQFRVSGNGGKGADLIKLVTTGNKVPKKKGIAIKKIIFTGHSLGGMLAQGAHYILQNGSNSRGFGEVSKAIQDHTVELYTLAFSAVTSLSSRNETIKIDNMINISYSDDGFTRSYGNTEYMHSILDIVAGGLKGHGHGATEKEKKDMVKMFGEAVLKVGVNALHQKLKNFLNSKTPIFKTYKHAGTIIHYKSKDAVPEIYTNDTFAETKEPVRETITYDMWIDQFHNGTVKNRNELGLSWWSNEQR